MEGRFVIANKENPDVPLFTFTSVGDSVSIGRDKRVCQICLGANAHGVSRVHMKIECCKRGTQHLLIAKDLSTYGTGYNGAPLTVVKERVIKDGDTLQVGLTYFVVNYFPDEALHDDDDDDFVRELPKETQSSSQAVRLGDNEGERRTPLKRSADLEGNEGAKRQKVCESAIVKRNDKQSESLGRQPKADESKKGAQSKSGLLVNMDATGDSVSQVASRHIVPDSCEQNYQRSTADSQNRAENRRKALRRVFVADTVDQTASGTKKVVQRPSKDLSDDDEVSVVYDSLERRVTGDDESRNAKPIARAPPFEDSIPTRSGGNDSEGRFALKDTSKRVGREKESVGLMGDSGTTDTIVGGLITEGHVGEINSQDIARPLFNSTAVNEGLRAHFDTGRFDDLVEADNNEKDKAVVPERPAESCSSPQPRKRGRPKKNAVVESAKTTVTSFFSSSKRSRNVDPVEEPVATTSNADDAAWPKRVKVEPIEESENHARIINEALAKKDVNFDKRTVKVEESFGKVKEEVTDPDDDRVLGMDMETLREKLEKTIQFANLERKLPPAFESSLSTSENSSSAPNFKRFRKAAQGSHGDPLLASSSRRTQMTFLSDLVDFRQL